MEASHTAASYERMCADALTSRGWRTKRIGRTGDQGADVVAEKVGIRVVLQCKLYGRPVGNGAIQEAYAAQAIKRAQYAAVVTPSGFTPAARDLARATRVLLLHHGDLDRADALFGVPSATAKVVVACWRCWVGLRLPAKRDGIVHCPECGTRQRILT